MVHTRKYNLHHASLATSDSSTLIEGVSYHATKTQQHQPAETSILAANKFTAREESISTTRLAGFVDDASVRHERFEDSSILANYILTAAKENTTLLGYFYGGKGGYADSLEAIRAHYHFRMSNCAQIGHPRGGAVYGGDLVHAKTKPEEPCFWSNMAPRKLLAIVAFAQKMGVTHLIESGRMGGMSAFMYDALGFTLTSVEYLPVKSVQQDLNKSAPGITLLNGDGSKVVPGVVKRLGSDKRIGVILDGPKHDAAYNLAMNLLNLKVSFVAIDDSQQLTRRIDKTSGIASFHLWDKRFLELFPLKREMQMVKRVHLQLPYITDNDCLSFLVKIT